jgi:hypothetical protein
MREERYRHQERLAGCPGSRGSCRLPEECLLKSPAVRLDNYNIRWPREGAASNHEAVAKMTVPGQVQMQVPKTPSVAHEATPEPETPKLAMSFWATEHDSNTCDRNVREC